MWCLRYWLLLARPPPTPYSLGVTKEGCYSIFTHKNRLTCLKLYQKLPKTLLQPLGEPEPKYLAQKVCFSPFLPCRRILPRGGPFCSLELAAWGRRVPYCSQSLPTSDTFQLQLITAEGSTDLSDATRRNLHELCLS